MRHGIFCAVLAVFLGICATSALPQNLQLDTDNTSAAKPVTLKPPVIEALTGGRDTPQWRAQSIALDRRENVTFRAGKPRSGDRLQWRFYFDGYVTAQGEIATYPGDPAADWVEFTLPIANNLPPKPTAQNRDFVIEFDVMDGNRRLYAPIRHVIRYGQGATAPVFASQDALYPELFNARTLEPYRFFVDFTRLEVIQAWEDADEPALIPLVIPFDGSELLLNRPAQGRVRVLSRGNPYQNVTDLSLEDGDSVFIPDRVGRYVFDTQMIGAREFDEGNPEFGGEDYISLRPFSDMWELTGSTFLFFGAMASESDGTRAETVLEIRRAILDAVEEELNGCLRKQEGVTDFLPLLGVADTSAALDSLECLEREAYEEAGLDTPFEKATYLDYLEAVLRAIGKETGINEELTSLEALVFPTNIFATVGALARIDDVLGFGHKAVSMRDVLLEGRPVKRVIDIRKKEKRIDFFKPSKPAEWVQVAHYRIHVEIGQCKERTGPPNTCTPFIHNDWFLGKRPYARR